MKLKSLVQKLGSFAYQLAILALMFYVGFILFRQINTNYQTNLEIDKFRQEISSLERQNKNLDNLLVYYQSAIYKELEARKRLGVKKPGETVLVSPENKDEEMSETKEKQTAEEGREREDIPNYLKWLEQILGRGDLFSAP